MTPFRPLIPQGKHFEALRPSSIYFLANLSLEVAIHIRILEIRKFDFWPLIDLLFWKVIILELWNHHQSIFRPILV
jgi:hypothetical protein